MYEYPKPFNLSTMQTVNELPQAERVPVNPVAVPVAVARNAVPDRYLPSMQQPIIGETIYNLSGAYFVMPQNQEINHIPHYKPIEEVMLYRTNPGIPRRESSVDRMFASSNTSPSLNSAEFIGRGRIGDVYGR